MLNKNLINLLLKLITSHPIFFAILTTSIILNGFLSIGVASTLAPLADYLMDPTLKNVNVITLKFISIFSFFGIKSDLLTFSMLFAIGNILNSIAVILLFYLNRWIGYTVLRDLTKEGFQKFLGTRWSFFSQVSHGRILNLFQSEIVKVGDAMTGLTTQIALVFQLAIALSLPVFLTPIMVFVTLAVLLLLTIPFLLLQSYTKELGVQNTLTSNRVMEILNETFQSVKVIIGFGKQDLSLLRYLKSYDDHMKIALKSQVLVTGISTMHYTIGIIAALAGMVVSLYFGGILSDIAISLWSLQRAVPLLNQMLVNKVNLDNFSGSYQQLLMFYGEAESHREDPGGDQLDSILNDIRLSNVSFQYANRAYLFENLNLVIQRKKMTALVGESGSGKSTIVDLIIGMQVPNSGSVILNDKSFEVWNKNSFRLKIGYVPQEPILFHTSIRENLLWSFDGASEKEIWLACDAANASDFIRKLPEGLETIVGDRGVRLSGGQRQRISLARALIRNPELLILDEATSSLDSESEALIQSSINNLKNKTTILVIAHRLSTIAKADLIYVLKNGSIVQEGSYDSLLSIKDGYFHKMVLAQS
jgi:ABC-type multidrug transport system fused ATPase/permease subunit